MSDGKQQFTAFCQQRGKTDGTTWVSTLKADSLAEALAEAAEGDVKLLHWDDQE